MTSEPPIIDPLNREQHLTYAQAAKLWPGRRVSPHTVWRCASKGKRGVKLPTIPTGRGCVTSREAIRWFFAELQRSKNEPRLASPKRHQIDPALEAECEAAGI